MTLKLTEIAAGVLIFEKQPYWGPELKRQFEDGSVLIRECRTVEDLLPRAGIFRQAVILMVLDDETADCLAWISRQLDRESKFPVIVIAAAELAHLEWVLREAGVAQFVHDELSGSRLARICRRFLGEEPGSVQRVAAADRR